MNARLRFAKRGEIRMTKEHANYANRIVQNPDILAGKPVIKDTRIPVQVILEYLAHNPDFDELLADYPRLTMDDVKACFEYAQTLVEATSKPNELAAPPVR
jgi:uncharacterized protein (DUF433 family)